MPEVPFAAWWAFWTQDTESVRNFFIILGGLVGLGLLWWRTANIHRQTKTLMRRHEAQVEADRERRITDNFARAVELLSSEKLEARLGAIYALERIARESRDDHWPIMETLTAYIRERAPWPPAQTTEVEPPELRPATDIQAALTVLGRRCRDHERPGQTLDLSQTDLRGADLGAGYFQKARFWDTHLEKANLWEAHLEGADFLGTHFGGAGLSQAHLKEATFFEVHLEGAWLIGSDITQEQFDSAYTDERTRVPGHIRQPIKPAGEVAEGEHAAENHEAAAQ